MKTLLLALGIALAGIIVVFLVLASAGIDKSIAGTIATAIVGGIPYLRESLDKQGLPGTRRWTNPTVLSFEGFGVPTPRLVLYGTLILAAAMNLASGFGGVIIGVSGFKLEEASAVLLGFAAVVVYPTAFLVGRWVGRRSISKGVVAVFLIAALARLATTILDMFVMSDQELAAVVGMKAWQQAAIGIPLFFVVGCLGYWRGRRQRLATYLSYLLGRVSEDTRETIVELAFAEASKRPNPTAAAH